jgi:hypothetical protein
MAFENIKRELQSNLDYNHVLFKNNDQSLGDYVILIDNGAVIGAYNTSPTGRFKMTTRAGFSIDKEIAQTSTDQGALKIKLIDNPDVLTEWKENYVVSVLAELSEAEVEPAVGTNEPVKDDEKATLIDPVSLDDIEYAVNEELKNQEIVDQKIGLDDFSNVTFKLLNDFIPSSDEQNFVKLATSTGKDINSLLGFSNGFLLSKILNASVALTLNGSIEYAKLVGTSAGDKIFIKAERPVEEDDNEDSVSQYVDDHLADGSDNVGTQSIVKEGFGDDDNESDADDRSDDTMPLIDLPHEAPAEETEPEPESTDDSTEDEPADVPDLSVPLLQPVQIGDPNELTALNITGQSTTDAVTDADSQVDEDDPYAGDGDAEAEAMLDSIESKHGDDVDSLVSAVEQAKQKLEELKARKDDVDNKIADLPVEESEQISKEIDSLREDRKELDDRINDLRSQKVDVDSQISDAKKRKADVDEKLAHKDELESEQTDLAAKIETLENVL